MNCLFLPVKVEGVKETFVRYWALMMLRTKSWQLGAAALTVGLGCLVGGCSSVTGADPAIASIKKACAEIPQEGKPGMTVLKMDTGLAAAYINAKKAVAEDTGQPTDANWKDFEISIEAEGVLWEKISQNSSPTTNAQQAFDANPQAAKDYPIVAVSSTLMGTCLAIHN